MKFTTSHALSGAMLLAEAAAQSQVTCKSGPHLIVARASLEAPGYGILKPVAGNITSKIPNSDSVPLAYPATIFGKPLYPESEKEGVGNLTQVIKEYVDACPDGKIALLGYSQGAHVIGDTLIGADYPTNTNNFPTTQGIAQKYVDAIFAVILMGDPAHIVDQSFDVGNSTMNGTFPRANSAKFASIGVASKMQSYCDAGDLYCASGKSLDIHVGYIPEYGPDAEKFVIDKWNALQSSGGNGTGSATSTGGSYPTGAASSTGGSYPTGAASSTGGSYVTGAASSYGSAATSGSAGGAGSPSSYAGAGSPTSPSAVSSSIAVGGASVIRPGTAYVVSTIVGAALAMVLC